MPKNAWMWHINRILDMPLVPICGSSEYGRALNIS